MVSLGIVLRRFRPELSGPRHAGLRPGSRPPKVQQEVDPQSLAPMPGKRRGEELGCVSWPMRYCRGGRPGNGRRKEARRSGDAQDGRSTGRDCFLPGTVRGAEVEWKLQRYPHSVDTIPGVGIVKPPRSGMSHHERETIKMVQRVRKLRGQLDAIERSLTNDGDCGDQLMLLAAVRGRRQRSDGRSAGDSYPFSSDGRLQGADRPGTGRRPHRPGARLSQMTSSVSPGVSVSGSW